MWMPVSSGRIVCGLAIAGLVWRFRSGIALLAFGAILGTFLLNVLNTEPSHFRYYVTAYPFIVVLAAGFAAELRGREKTDLLAGANRQKPGAEPLPDDPAVWGQVRDLAPHS